MWVVVWQVLVTDSPEEDWHISTAEKNMILESLKEDGTSKLVCMGKRDDDEKRSVNLCELSKLE